MELPQSAYRTGYADIAITGAVFLLWTRGCRRRRKARPNNRDESQLRLNTNYHFEVMLIAVWEWNTSISDLIELLAGASAVSV